MSNKTNNSWLAGKKIWIAGHNGMVGSSLIRILENKDCELLTVDKSELDLRDRPIVKEWMQDSKPDIVVLAAAKVGGILANDSLPIEFLNDNLQIQDSVINSSAACNVEKLLFLGSSCIYPKLSEQPIQESSLLTGPLEPTNQWYAMAKIAGIKLCQAYNKQNGCNFISAMPTNLYGPNDNFDLVSSHVLPALMSKIHDAKLTNKPFVTVWGSGNPMREFLHVDDLASACMFLLDSYSGTEPVNIGSGHDLKISELARLICEVVGFQGNIEFDTSKPDGTPRKLLSCEKINTLGWNSSISLREGIQSTYEWFVSNQHTSKLVDAA